MIKLKLNKAEAVLLVWDMTETVDELKLLLRNFNEYAVEFEQIPTEKRQKEFLCTRLLVNELHGHPMLVSYDKDGKPVLTNSEAYISFTHSANWVGVIYHQNARVGIDMECPSDKILKVASRFCSEEEKTYFHVPENRDELLLVWCAKETVFKIIGSPVTDFAKTMQVLPFQTEDSGVFKLKLLNENKILDIHYFRTLNYTLTYCIL